MCFVRVSFAWGDCLLQLLFLRFSAHGRWTRLDKPPLHGSSHPLPGSIHQKVFFFSRAMGRRAKVLSFLFWHCFPLPPGTALMRFVIFPYNVPLAAFFLSQIPPAWSPTFPPEKSPSSPHILLPFLSPCPPGSTEGVCHIFFLVLSLAGTPSGAMQHCLPSLRQARLPPLLITLFHF